MNDVLWGSCFPKLTDISEDLYKTAISSLMLKEYPAGYTILELGAACSHFAYLISGSLDIKVVSKSGREQTIVNISKDDFCVLNTICIISGGEYPAKASTTSYSEILFIEETMFELLLHESRLFRKFIFKGINVQLAEIFNQYQQLLLPNISERLAAYLVIHSKNGTKPIHITQKELANNLGTVREVVSRHMSFFKKNAWLDYSRGRIDLVNHEILAQLGEDYIDE